MTDDELSAAIDNLARIKNGEDPRTEHDDPLQIAVDEVDRLFEEHGDGAKITFTGDTPGLVENELRRQHIDVAVARWDRKNGNIRYNAKHTKTRHNKRVTGRVNASGRYAITINERIVEDDGVDAFIDTVRHEVAHAIAYEDPSLGGRGHSPEHGPGWKDWARTVGADPKSCHNKKSTDYNYWYACPSGCWKSGRVRKSKKIKHPGRYHCSTCGESCISWADDAERPTEPGETSGVW